MPHFVGLVSMKEMAICIVDEAGKRLWEGNVCCSAEAIAQAIRIRAPALARAGERIVEMCTTMINHMSGPAKIFGLSLSAGKGQVFEHSVRCALPSDPVLRNLFERLLSVLSDLKKQRCAFDRQLAHFDREDATCRLSSSLPGVGSFTAIAFVT